VAKKNVLDIRRETVSVPTDSKRKK
jgi:hypothetical protein